MTKKCCNNCRFYFEENAECRRFPPTVYISESDSTQTTFQKFPEVFDYEWCGEHKQIQEPQLHI